MRLLWVAGLVGALSALIGAAACGSSTDPQAVPAIALRTVPDGGSAFIEVTGLSAETRRILDRAALAPDQWPTVLRVTVGPDAPAVLGTYEAEGGSVRFTPFFPFDPGREYLVRFEPGRLPGASSGGAVDARVSLPAPTAEPSTVVARIYPSGDVVPENLLRIYVEFSAPMGRKSGVEHIRLLDHAGQEIPGAVLPLDYEFWSPDHTRFTVFFDPGRVKNGLLPNQQMGRPLETGRTVTLTISREWRDDRGLPLKDDFRRIYRVGPADERPLQTTEWRIRSPTAGGRDSVVVTFPEPLDHGLLMRALGVTRQAQTIDGEIVVDEAETRWAFRPADPWLAGTYHLLALDILEDLAGNQIGRAFEVDNFETVDKSPNPQTITIPFTVR